MHPRAHRVAQGRIDHLMSFDQPLALELIANHQRFEMVATAGRVLHLDMGRHSDKKRKPQFSRR